ncbi:MAG: T9SS type A sorting domain-containing protein [Saprospiraceae bacterium]
MRYFHLAFSLFLLTHAAPAQTFSPNPGPLLEKAVALELATECYIFFENPGGDSLRLRWKTIAKSHPAEWTLDLCDFGLCYVGIPASGLMNFATGTERPYLKLIAQPGTVPGSAWVGFRVWEDGNPANTVEVFFSLYTPGFTSAPEADGPAEVLVYPNPTTGLFFWKNTSARPAFARLADATGRILWAGTTAAGGKQQLDLSAWPAGSYFLQTESGTAVVQRVR